MTKAPPQPWPSLQRAVRRAGTSYRRLAEHTGISVASISAYSRGARRPSEKTIAKIADALGVPYDELRVDVPFATSPTELLKEIDSLVDLLNQRVETAQTALKQAEARRDQLHQFAAGAA